MHQLDQKLVELIPFFLEVVDDVDHLLDIFVDGKSFVPLLVPDFDLYSVFIAETGG